MDFKNILQGLKSYSPYQFAIFRIILGIYLVIHFADLLPYAAEIWSDRGILPLPEANATYGFFPNILHIITHHYIVTAFLGGLLFCAVLFTLGIKRNWVALILWYGWVCLFDRNNLIANPSLPFIAWLLLCSAVIPRGEALCLFQKSDENWAFPKILFIGAWFIMAAAYSISGYDKLHSISWANGSAIFHLLNNPLARNGVLRSFFLGLSPLILKSMTWLILGIELLFFPLALWRKSRPFIWLAAIFMHLGILVLIDFADLTLGMLMIHWFTFDARWLAPSKNANSKHIVFFDGVCGLCNHFIDFLLKEDQYDVLQFAPLQGETVKNYVPNLDTKNLSTVIFYSNGKTYEQSDAVLALMYELGGIWRLAIVFRIIPAFIRDAVYRFIAQNRLKWFGEKESCRLPTQKERGKLLL